MCFEIESVTYRAEALEAKARREAAKAFIQGCAAAVSVGAFASAAVAVVIGPEWLALALLSLGPLAAAFGIYMGERVAWMR